MYMYDWLDEERISKLIPEEEIENIKASYRYIHLDDESYAFSKSPDIEIVTGFPMVREYFDDIGDLSDDFAYDVESEEEYLFCYAECILKCHILCAAQIAFGFPLWQDPKFLEWEKPIREALKEIDDYAAENDDEFCFPRFFPYYSNEYVAYPRFMIRWISDVMEEFFEKADANGYYLSPEERQKQFEKASRELRMIEDFLSGKSTDLDFKNSTSE